LYSCFSNFVFCSFSKSSYPFLSLSLSLEMLQGTKGGTQLKGRGYGIGGEVQKTLKNNEKKRDPRRRKHRVMGRDKTPSGSVVSCSEFPTRPYRGGGGGVKM